MLIISEAEVERLLDSFELSAAMQRALIEFSAGRVTQPVRSIVPVTAFAGFMGLMPAVYGDVMGAKLVTVFPRNAARGLHTHDALVALFRAETGQPLAVLGGRIITERRTAAVSSLATRELSHPNARILAILGSGAQARSHYEALRHVRDFEEVRVWSRTPQHAAAFAEAIGARATSAEDAVAGADVIVTATSAQQPILRAEWLKPNAYINAIGAVGPNNHEIDAEAVRQAAIIVESRAAATVESAEVIQSGASIYAELGELLSGDRAKPPAGLTIYKSLGIAVEDIAAAKLVYEKLIY